MIHLEFLYYFLIAVGYFVLRDLRKVIIKTDRGECNKPQIHALDKCQTAPKVLYQATNKQKYYHELKQ